MTGDTDPEDAIRAFVAVEIPEQVRAELALVQEGLKRAGARVSWVKPANMHISLAFLGNIYPGTVELIGLGMDEICAAHDQFAFDIANVGMFGSTRSPRVIWAGVRNAGALAAVQSEIADAVRQAGVALEKRAFRAHLTLGRVRSSRAGQALARAIDSIGPKDFGTVPVTRILLVRSVLSSSGPEYSIVHAADLA